MIHSHWEKEVCAGFLLYSFLKIVCNQYPNKKNVKSHIVEEKKKSN